MVVPLKILVALVAALIVVWTARWLVRSSGPWSRFWMVFLLSFLSVWGAGIWVTSWEPINGEAPILFLVAVGVVVAGLLAVAGYLLVAGRRIPTAFKPEGTMIGAVYQLPFWILIILLTFTILLRYLT